MSAKKRSRFGSKREIEPGVWRVSATHGRDPSTGKRRTIDRTVYGSEAVADRELVRIGVELGHKPSRKDLTVKDFYVDYWLPDIEKRVREGTYVGYESKIRVHIVPGLGSWRMADLDKFAVRRWASRLSGAPRSRHHIIRVFRESMREAVDWGFLAEDPTVRLPMPKLRRPPKRVLDVEGAVALMRAFRGHPVEAAVLIGLGAGLRVSEMAARDWSDLDFDEGTIHVQDGLHYTKRKGLYLDETKSEKSNRTAVVVPLMMDRLKEIRGIGPLFPNAEGIRRSPGAIASAYKNHTGKSGIAFVPMMNLRHTHAMIARNAGASLDDLADHLGHATSQVTRDHYVESDIIVERRLAAILDGAFRAATRDKSSKTDANQPDSSALDTESKRSQQGT